jgi:cyclohexa-1,5-dienecarbonyl-CoA hydratase
MQTQAETTFQFLTLESDGAVARLVLRRPPLNIMGLEMIEEINRALDELGSEPALRALVIAAEGKAFSAGVAVEDHLPERVKPTLRAFHDVFRRLRRLPCPTIAAVQGPALGGGCELACFADVVIASENATFGQPEIKLGVFPPVAAIHFPQRIGVARTLQMLLSGDTMSAHEAKAIGLVDYVAAREDLERSVTAAADAFRGKSAPALRLARRAVLDAAYGDFEARLREAEALFLEELMRTQDAVGGLVAFLEKRAPAWTHR